MDIISTLNTAFTQVQRSESMSFSSNGDDSKVSFRERESISNAPDLRGGHKGKNGHRTNSLENRMQSAINSAVDYDRSERGTIQLRTQEGDIVKLKFMNSESMNAQSQQFESGGSVVSDFSMNGSDFSKFKVVVEGDLNGAELSAVRDVLIQAREMANTFFDGDVKEAFGMASQFNIDSEQLSNVKMKLKVTEDYTYASAVMNPPDGQNHLTPPSDTTMPISPVVTSVPTVTPTNTQPDTAAIAVPDLLSNLTATAPASEPEDSQITQEAPFTPPPVETLVHSEPGPGDQLNGVLSTITNFLSQLTSSMNSIGQQFQGQNSPSALSFSGGFQLQVVSAMVGQMESQLNQEAPSGNSLASETINLMAMKMDAHVDTMI